MSPGFCGPATAICGPLSAIACTGLLLGRTMAVWPSRLRSLAGDGAFQSATTTQPWFANSCASTSPTATQPTPVPWLTSQSYWLSGKTFPGTGSGIGTLRRALTAATNVAPLLAGRGSLPTGLPVSQLTFCPDNQRLSTSIASSCWARTAPAREIGRPSPSLITGGSTCTSAGGTTVS